MAKCCDMPHPRMGKPALTRTPRESEKPVRHPAAVSLESRLRFPDPDRQGPATRSKTPPPDGDGHPATRQTTWGSMYLKKPVK